MRKLRLDNSAISLLACKRRFQLIAIEGRRSGDTKETLAGSAFHTVQELIDKGHEVDTALSLAADKHPTVDMSRVVGATTLYRLTNKVYPPITLLNGQPAVEVKFCFPYGTFEPDIEVELLGTIDRCYIDPTPDVLVIKDYKTSAAVTTSHQESVVSSYDLSFQLYFYLHALLNGGFLPNSYLDYIRSGRYRLEYDFIFFDSKPPAFKRLVKTSLPPDMLFREVPFIIASKVAEAVQILRLADNPAPHDGMTVYNFCKYCQFKPGCLHMGTERELEFLSRFDRSEYNPLTFR